MKILVVDDDAGTAEPVKACLAARSHTVETSGDGADGSFLARSYEYDAIVLDCGLPKKDGLTVCREVRAAGKMTPIIFLSVDDDVATKVAALRAGADDYMTKPFSLDELSARIDAVTRRAPDVKSPVLEVGDVRLCRDTHTVLRSGRRIRLTRKEINMLEYFMKSPGTIVSRAQLMEHVWTADSNPFSNTVEAHIRNLRKKLNDGGAPNMIANIPGRGYLIDTPERLAKL